MAAPQTGLTSRQIGDIGYPRTVHGNPPTSERDNNALPNLFMKLHSQLLLMLYSRSFHTTHNGIQRDTIQWNSSLCTPRTSQRTRGYLRSNDGVPLAGNKLIQMGRGFGGRRTSPPGGCYLYSLFICGTVLAVVEGICFAV